MILCKASRIEIVSARWCGFFYSFDRIYRAVFFIELKKTGPTMQLTLIQNPDNTKSVLYKLARIIYAETLATSLRITEAMASMIYNIHIKYKKSFENIANDSNLFDSLNVQSKRNKYLNVNIDDRKFQMCLRVVQKMMNGNLSDSVVGATNFHHADVMPDWAINRGYIAEFDDLLFYL